jgi:HEAT repeat protein
MKRRTKFLVAGAALIVGVGVAAVFDPHARIAGWVKGEPFYAGRSASAWRRDLGQADLNGRIKATQELAAGKADAVPVLAAVLRTSDAAETRWRAADALGRIGDAARPAAAELIRALDDPDPHVGAVAARSLGDLAPDVPVAVPALVRAFPRVEAVRAVAEYGPVAAEAVEPLTGLLAHADPAVRWNAARALGKLRGTAAAAVPALANALTDPAQEVREHAAEALGEIGPAATAALPALVRALSDPVPRVRRDAVRSLGNLGPAAKPALADVQARKKDDDPEVRATAERAERLIDPSLAGKKGDGGGE